MRQQNHVLKFIAVLLRYVLLEAQSEGGERRLLVRGDPRCEFHEQILQRTQREPEVIGENLSTLACPELPCKHGLKSTHRLPQDFSVSVVGEWSTRRKGSS